MGFYWSQRKTEVNQGGGPDSGRGNFRNFSRFSRGALINLQCHSQPFVSHNSLLDAESKLGKMLAAVDEEIYPVLGRFY